MTKLRLSDDLTLPVDVVTQTVAILAKRRAGKSYTMRRLAEQLFLANQQIVIVDPKGDQWGIRSASDGKAPGLSIVILGGERGDVPLAPNSGEVVAKLVVEERVSVLLDLSTFRKNEVATFMTAFLENLYRLKAREIYRTPVMLVIDEADAIAPQKPQHGEERMLGAAEDIVRRGGQRGIGCVLVSQRSAVLNKNVLTQAQVLVALRTIAPQDLAAMKAWIDVHGTVEQCKTLMDSLPSLPIGDAWFWSPGWPTIDGIFKRVHVLPIETFDSGATPKPGVTPVAPKKVADVDLDALKRQMASTIEKAKADDPKALRARIHQLEKDQVPAVVAPTIKEVPVLKDSQLTRITSLIKQAGALEEKLRYLAGEISVEATKLASAMHPLQTIHTIPIRHDTSVRDTPRAEPRGHGIRVNNHSVGDPENSAQLSKMARTMLTVLAQHPDGLTKSQILVHAEYRSSGSVSSTFAQLVTNGWVSIGAGRMMITSKGLSELGPYEPLPTGAALLQHLLDGNKLSKMEKALLSSVAKEYPSDVSKGHVLEQTGYASSGSVSSAFAKLVACNYVRAMGSSLLKLSEELTS